VPTKYPQTTFRVTIFFGLHPNHFEFTISGKYATTENINPCEVLMESVYLAIVISLALVALAIIFRDKIKSFSIKLTRAGDKVSGELGSLFRDNSPSDNRFSQVKKSQINAGITVTDNNFSGETSLEMKGSDLHFDQNTTAQISNVKLEGEGIKVISNDMPGEKTIINLSSDLRPSRSGDHKSDEKSPRVRTGETSRNILVSADTPEVAMESMKQPNIEQN
jgi:hypothetical protein